MGGWEGRQNKTTAVSLDCVAYDTSWYIELGCKMLQYGIDMDLWGYFQRTLAHKMSVWEFQNSRLPPALGLPLAQFHTLFHNDLQIILSKQLIYAEHICPNPGPQASNSRGRVLAAAWLSHVFSARSRTEAKYKEFVSMLPFISHTQLIWASYLFERHWSVTPTVAVTLRSHTPVSSHQANSEASATIFKIGLVRFEEHLVSKHEPVWGLLFNSWETYCVTCCKVENIMKCMLAACWQEERQSSPAIVRGFNTLPPDQTSI